MSDSVLQNIPPSYQYGQYQLDPNVQASVDAFNGEAEGIFYWLQNYPIADYRTDPISGDLLSWVGLGLYNMPRTVQVSTVYNRSLSIADSPYGNIAFASTDYQNFTSTVLNLTDDQYRRCITWNIYSGDGWVFNTTWLRNRVARFLYSADGYSDITIGELSNVNINWLGDRQAQIFAVTQDTALVDLMNIAILNEYLQTPLGYNFTLTAIDFDINNTDFGGDIL
jgi:hypothetical protein